MKKTKSQDRPGTGYPEWTPLPSGFTVYIYLSVLIFGRYTGGVRYEMIKITILIIL